jgi:cell volume regulation protein A
MNLLYVIAVALLSYSLAQQFGGNGYLAAYLCGIIMGNAKIPNRASIVQFFDTIDWVAQIIIFFLLGLVVIPQNVPAWILPGLALAAFLLLIARPLSVFAIFPFFKVDGKRNPVGKCLFISWAGIRGAASFVFVFLALSSGVPVQSDLISLIFVAVLASILVQGTLFPKVADKLGIIDDQGDYTITFNDFQEESESAFFKVFVPETHDWAGKALKDITIGNSMLVVLIKRGERTVTPRGETVIQPGDVLVISGESYQGDAGTQITRSIIEADDPWANRSIKELELPANTLIVSIVREDGTAITPKGWVKIQPHDTLTLFTWD